MFARWTIAIGNSKNADIENKIIIFIFCIEFICIINYIKNYIIDGMCIEIKSDT